MRNLREEICLALAQEGATCYYVGGAVRDELLGLTPTDFDVEVFNVSPGDLQTTLERFGPVNAVGKSFGVLVLRTPEGKIDFTIPRRDNRQGKGHRGFLVEVDPLMTVHEAASRRDFTINAIYKNAITGEIIDNFEGLEHLQHRQLRAVSEHFSEDPLRVLRGMQFASRFNMTLPAYGNTSDMCALMGDEYDTLPQERIGEEWRKWASGDYPSQGLRFLQKAGWLGLYPDINNTIGVPQDHLWHPEGWSATELQWCPNSFDASTFSFHSSCTRPTKTFMIEDRLTTLRQFFSSSPTQTTGDPELNSTSFTQTAVAFPFSSFSKASSTRPFNFVPTSSLGPTVITDTKSLVWTFGRTAINADKVVRVMFKIPFGRVFSIVSGAVNDLEIIQTIIHPVAIYMMDSDSASSVGTANVSVPIVVVDARSASVDGNVLCYFDLAVIRDFNHEEVPQKRLLVGAPDLFLEVKEGNVYTHVNHVCDAMAKICIRDGVSGEDREVLMFAALCHDFGKVTTTTFDGDPPRYRSRGHAEAGVPIARGFLKSIGIFDRVIERVLPLVAEHMWPTWEEQSRRTVRRLKLRLGKATLDELLLLMEADVSGRPPYPPTKCEGYEMMKSLAAELPPTIDPILTGRHIIAEGVTDGKEIGFIKRMAFTHQLAEDIVDEASAIEWLKTYLNKERREGELNVVQECKNREESEKLNY